MAGKIATTAARPMGGRSIEGGRFGGGSPAFSSAKFKDFGNPAGLKAGVAAEKFTVSSVVNGQRRSGLGEKAYDPNFTFRNRSLPETQQIQRLPRTRVRENPLTFPEFSIHTVPKPDTSRIKVKELPSGKIQIDSPGKARAQEIMADLQHNFVPTRKPERKPAIEVHPRTKPVVDVPVLLPEARQDVIPSRIRILENSPVKVQTVQPENVPVVLDSAAIPPAKKTTAKQRSSLRHSAIYSALLVKKLRQQEAPWQITETRDERNSLVKLVKQKAGLTVANPKFLEQAQVKPLPSVNISQVTAPETSPALAVSPKAAVDTKPHTATFPVAIGNHKEPPPPFEDASPRNQISVSVDERAADVRIRTMVNGIETAAQLTGKKTEVDGNIAVRFINLHTREARSGLLDQLRLSVYDGTIGETIKKYASNHFYLPTAAESVRKIVENFRPAVLSRGRYITKREVLLVTGGKDPDAK